MLCKVEKRRPRSHECCKPPVKRLDQVEQSKSQSLPFQILEAWPQILSAHDDWKWYTTIMQSGVQKKQIQMSDVGSLQKLRVLLSQLFKKTWEFANSLISPLCYLPWKVPATPPWLDRRVGRCQHIQGSFAHLQHQVITTMSRHESQILCQFLLLNQWERAIASILRRPCCLFKMLQLCRLESSYPNDEVADPATAGFMIMIFLEWDQTQARLGHSCPIFEPG